MSLQRTTDQFALINRGKVDAKGLEGVNGGYGRNRNPGLLGFLDEKGAQTIDILIPRMFVMTLNVVTTYVVQVGSMSMDGTANLAQVQNRPTNTFARDDISS